MESVTQDDVEALQAATGETRFYLSGVGRLLLKNLLYIWSIEDVEEAEVVNLFTHLTCSHSPPMSKTHLLYQGGAWSGQSLTYIYWWMVNLVKSDFNIKIVI